MIKKFLILMILLGIFTLSGCNNQSYEEMKSEERYIVTIENHSYETGYSTRVYTIKDKITGNTYISLDNGVHLTPLKEKNI